MAKGHTCAQNTYTISGKSVTLYEICTRSSNIKVSSFARRYHQTGTVKTLSASGEYGINASWFDNSSGGDHHIMNLAYQNGVRQGCILNDAEIHEIHRVLPDGFTNSVGKSAIYRANGSLGFSSNIVNSSSSLVSNSTWLQGGINLFLGESEGETKLKSEREGLYGGDARRSAMVADLANDKVYLFAVTQGITPETLRAVIMKRLSIQEGNTAHKYRGIMLDGGGSTQMAGAAINIRSSENRPIPQIVGLNDKT